MERSNNHVFNSRPLVPSRQSLPCCSFPVFLTTFIIMGLSVSVLGPSVIFFEEISNTWEDEIALIFTARSVGALGGWLLSIAFLEGTPKYCGCLMGVGLSGLTIINFSLAFLRRLWWLMGVFALQGGFLVVSAQGCLTYVISRGGRRKRQIHQILVFCSLIGYALAPILMIPLTCNQQVLLKDKSSLVMTNVSSVANHPINPNLHRSRRLAELNSDPTTFAPSLLSHAIGSTNTDSHFTPVTMADVSMPVLATSPSPRVPITPTSSSSDEGYKTTSETSTEPLPGSRSPTNEFSFTPTGASETPIPPLATDNKEQTEDPKPTGKSNQIPLHSSDEMSTVPSFSPKTITITTTATTTDKDRPLLDNVFSDTIMQTTRSTTAIHEISVQPVANPATFPSFSANTTSGPGLPLTNITTKQTEVPKKPSIVDAMHLSQDSRTADGSKTVAKMKELDEDVRLTEVDNDNQPAMPVRPPVSLESPQLAKVKPQPTTTKTTPVVSPSTIQSPQFPPSVNATPPSRPKFQEAGGNSPAKHRLSLTEVDSQDPRKPSVVDAVHLKQDHNSADGSDTVVKMKEGVRHNEAQNKPPEMEVEKPFPPPVSTSEGADQNKSIVSPRGPRVPETSQLPPHPGQQVPSPRGNHPEGVTSTKNETRISSSSLPPAVMLLKETGNRKNEEGERVTERPPVSLNETKIPNQPSMEDEMSYKQRSNDSYSLHSSYTSQWNRFAPKPWNHHLTREQFLYQHLRSVCDRCCSACLPTVTCPRSLFGNDKHRDMDTNFDLEAAEKTELINDPPTLDFPTAPTGRVSPKCFRFEEANNPVSSGAATDLANGIADSNAGKGGVGFRQVSSSPNFAVLRSPQPILRNSANGLTPATSTYLWYNPEPTIWPKISWPRNFWLILSAFLFAGLETTFGAFLHTFTLRTLHWNPVVGLLTHLFSYLQYDALWVTAVFWCGNILGRLSCLCLGPSSDMGVTLLQGAIDLTSLHKSHGTSNPRRHRTTKIAILVTRSAGALICVVSAGMLKHFTKAYYVYQHKPANLLLELWSYSKDRATWIGSFGIGLGLGVTASSGLSVCNRLGKRLHLAGLLGQMFLPAVSGYITERMFYKNASQTLGRTSLILSVLLFFSLAVDLVLRLIRHFSWWKSFTDYFRFVPLKQPAAKVTAAQKKKASNVVVGRSSPNMDGFETPLRQQSLESEPAAAIPLREVNFSPSSSAQKKIPLSVVVSHPSSD